LDTSVLRDPVFIAKIVDFVVFVIALVFAWNKVIARQLEDQQEKQNKEVEGAQQALVEAQAAIENSRAALDIAQADSKRMVDFGAAQAERLVADTKVEAEAHATRVLAHASGELDRERYRVRRELLEDTVERAHQHARRIVAEELDPARQRALVERLLTDLERSHA
jgi:F-type H+-transporting ATPase subunit b